MTIDEATRTMVKPILVELRRRYYRGALPSSLPGVVLRLLRIDQDPDAYGSRRLEVGSGPYPQAGYLHVDVALDASHLEAIAPMWQLPFPTGWATEILSVHSLEHVPPPRLLETLREWHRVLISGGLVRISVPNVPAIFDAFVRADVPHKWPLMGSVLGMYCGEDVRTPERLTTPADHQVLFDAPLLRWALEAAGFTDVDDRTGQLTDRHVEPWSHLVENYSLILEARA